MESILCFFSKKKKFYNKRNSELSFSTHKVGRPKRNFEMSQAKIVGSS